MVSSAIRLYYGEKIGSKSCCTGRLFLRGADESYPPLLIGWGRRHMLPHMGSTSYQELCFEQVPIHGMRAKGMDRVHHSTWGERCPADAALPILFKILYV